MKDLIDALNGLSENDIIEKWDRILFFKNVKNKQNVALACEFVAQYLLNKSNNGVAIGDMTTLSFPLIVRIFRNVEADILIDTILDNVVKIMKCC